MKFEYKKVVIVGCGGAGKSTLAREMGEKFSLPVVHLDKLYWLPNWINRSDEEFDDMLKIELKKPYWIIDGNYIRTLEWRLIYADLCVFLDYDTDLCLQSVNKRVEMYKNKSRPDMTEGCLEQNDPEFIEWINSYRENVRPKQLEILKSCKKDYVIFTSREQTQEWLDSFDCTKK